ncbi:uncharacterized protein LOC112203426 [Rosa chinensis]|uniref:uncharacterized protein LOC112203426 n=1 Tax=Rosa chinensis TaxID=74649 RepID=UPI000D087CDF|nr:uncharacterized protein LOC112203426 [Rosa chinensis]
MAKRRVLKWRAHPQGWMKINFDGAFDSGTSRAAVGFVVRDDTGTYMDAAGKIIYHIVSAEHAELVTCREAIGFVINHSLHLVIFETYCLTLKQQLCQTRTQNISALGRLYDDISEDLGSIPNSRLVHARREANKVAHLLAAHASAHDLDFYWSHAPFFIQDVINEEKFVL